VLTTVFNERCSNENGTVYDLQGPVRNLCRCHITEQTEPTEEGWYFWISWKDEQWYTQEATGEAFGTISACQESYSQIVIENGLAGYPYCADVPYNHDPNRCIVSRTECTLNE
jgi:hypothetical protein